MRHALAAIPFAFSACAYVPQRAVSPPPSVVLIVVDALRPDRLTPYGAARDTSPRLARFAADGALFKRAIAQSNWTLPSLATIMTGLYPSEHRAVYAPSSGDWPIRLEEGRYAPGGASRLDPSRVTLAERFEARGYRTEAVVSGGFCRSEFGFKQGFNEYHNLGSRLNVILPRIKEALNREPGRPYFLYIHLSDVHDPYEPSGPYKSLWTDPAYQGFADGGRDSLSRVRANGRTPGADDIAQLLALYDGSIRELDDQLADLIDSIGPKAIVALTSDHGESFGEHGRLQHGGDAYDEQIRVPLILRAPGRKPGRVIEPVVELAGLAPTLLELAGAARRDGLMGRSFAALLDGGPWTERPAFIEAASNRPSSAGQPFGLIALRSRDRKFIRSLITGHEELYDLTNDPAETLNVAARRPDEMRHWRRILDERVMAIRRTAGELPLVDESPTEIDAAIMEKLRASGYVP